MTREEVIEQIRSGIGQARVSQRTAIKMRNQLADKYAQGREDGMIYALRLIEDYMDQ